jgi:serine protease AprX
MNTIKIFKLKQYISIGLGIILILTLIGIPGSSFVSTITKSQESSYIIQGKSMDAVVELVEKYEGTVTSRLEIINGVAAILPPSAIAHLLAEPMITTITPNMTVKTVDKDEQYAMDKAKKKGGAPATDYPDVVGADLVWSQGVIGEGVTVAVVDTGLANHPGTTQDVNGKPGRILGWISFVDKCRKPPCDGNGHGSHVGGIIANTEVGADGEWNGVAPGVNLVGVQVLGKKGDGNYETVIQGIQWVVQNKDKYNIRIMNLSLVSPVQSPYWADPLSQAVMQAWANGIVVVVAVGNNGPDPMSVGVPGNNPYVITVGAFTDNYTPNDWSDDYITPFSSAGPSLDGFVKPDIVAPGAHIVSTMMNDSYLKKQHQAKKVGDSYFEMAGTSQAAAVVSGIAALVLSQNPNLTPDEVKYRIMNTAFPWIDPATGQALYSMWQQGSGRVNTPDAVFADIQGAANQGLDIAADLSGTQHYEGYSYYDDTTGQFRLNGDFNEWTNGFGVWAGDYSARPGGFGVWAGRFGVWAGRFGVWAGGFGVWAGGFGVWAGGFGVWAGGFGVWAGGFGVWAGGYDAWTGSEPWAQSGYASAGFVQSFLEGNIPNATSSTTSVGRWVDE